MAPPESPAPHISESERRLRDLDMMRQSFEKFGDQIVDSSQRLRNIEMAILMRAHGATDKDEDEFVAATNESFSILHLWGISLKSYVAHIKDLRERGEIDASTRDELIEELNFRNQRFQETWSRIASISGFMKEHEEGRKRTARESSEGKERLDAVEQNYEGIRELRGRTIDEYEATLAEIREWVKKLPPPTINAIPHIDALTPSQIEAQDKFSELLRKFNALTEVFTFGEEREYESELPFDQAMSAKYGPLKQPLKKWIEKEADDLMRSKGLKTLEERITEIRQMRRELQEAGRLTHDDIRQHLQEHEQQRRVITVINTEVEELIAENLQRTLRRGPKAE